jgi:hypothetical protein
MGHGQDAAMRPDFKDPSSFYIKINEQDYLARGGGYSPELPLTQNPERARNILRDATDLDINLIRWGATLLTTDCSNSMNARGRPLKKVI